MMGTDFNERIWLTWLVKMRIIIITCLLAIELAITSVTPTKVSLAYQKLQEVLEYFSKSEVLAFDRSAQDQFEAFQRSDVRIGTMDLRIAAIAFTNNCTLLSGNLRDFRRVPGLTVQDWIHQ